MSDVVQRTYSMIIAAMVRTVEAVALPPRLIGERMLVAPVKPNPVIILHGISDSQKGSQDMAWSLRRDGFTVYTPTKPYSGLQGVELNVEFLREYIEEVKRLTGAKQVDLIGHSQGGVDILTYIREGGAANVGRAVFLNSPLHGVSGYWRPLIDAVKGVRILRNILPKGLGQLDERDPLFQKLHAGPLPKSVQFTSIYAKDQDGIVQPANSPHLPGARNIAISTNRWGIGRKKGPHHLWVNHYSDAAYNAIRGALMERPGSR